jgi:HAD superfamily hydrolase (TIGR01509 family)
MARLAALLWDVDGTLAETERDGHRVAFNLAFEALGLPWRWDDALYGELLHVSGGRERLLFDMARRREAPAVAREREALARELHARKNAFYAALVGGGGIALRGGVAELMGDCRERGVRMAIATTTSRANLDALLAFHLGPGWRDGFAAVVCGEDVQCKKPDPEVYLQVLARLGADPLRTAAIEDSPGGVAAAQAAGIPVLVTRSAYFEHATIEGAIAIGPGLHDRRGWRPATAPDGHGAGALARVGLDDIEAWCAAMDLVSQFD